MSATATHDAYGIPPRRARRWRDHDADHDLRRWSPWTAPKPVLVAAMILGFIVFFPIGFLVLGFMIGAGRFGRRWARRWGMDPSGSAEADRDRSGWCSHHGGSSGNAAFDEYRVETLRRLEEEQKDFAAFLERLRFARDRAEFEQFMTDRRPHPAQDENRD